MIKVAVSLVFLMLFTQSAFADEKEPVDIKSRLTPANLDFSGFDQEIDTYLKTIPDERKKIESMRVGVVKNFKKMVQKVLSRSPYEGKIYLKDKSLSGKIMEAKDTSLTVLTSGNETISIAWEDIHSRQYADIFIAEAVSKGEDLPVDKKPKEAEKTFKKAGNYYFALAIFYDWYGNEAASKIFRRKAGILNSELPEKIKELWPEEEALKN